MGDPKIDVVAVPPNPEPKKEPLEVVVAVAAGGAVVFPKPLKIDVADEPIAVVAAAAVVVVVKFSALPENGEVTGAAVVLVLAAGVVVSTFVPNTLEEKRLFCVSTTRLVAVTAVGIAVVVALTVGEQIFKLSSTALVSFGAAAVCFWSTEPTGAAAAAAAFPPNVNGPPDDMPPKNDFVVDAADEAGGMAVTVTDEGNVILVPPELTVVKDGTPPPPTGLLLLSVVEPIKVVCGIVKEKLGVAGRAGSSFLTVVVVKLSPPNPLNPVAAAAGESTMDFEPKAFGATFSLTATLIAAFVSNGCCLLPTFELSPKPPNDGFAVINGVF